MNVCYLCKSSKKDDIQYGEFLQNKNMGVHTFCLYLSSNLSQRGEDDEGFLGFLEADIVAEKRRVSQLKCCYCRKKYANVGCCEKRCSHSFHFICGLENGAQNQFCNSFKSYCSKHIRKWNTVQPAKSDTCLICYENLVGPKENNSEVNVIQAPCCRNGWFHKLCLLQFAKTAGYFFKCPLCNDAKIFRQQLPSRGIYIPNRDAAWELEPNAFAELLERPSQCSAIQCENRKGRGNASGSNPLLLCSTCGSTAMHKLCLPHRGSRFHCADCKIAVEERDSGRESFNCPNNDEEIDVCNVSDHEDLEIIRSLLPDSNLKNDQKSEHCSSEEEITTTRRNRSLILNSDSDSELSNTSNERYNPSDQQSNNHVLKTQQVKEAKGRNVTPITKQNTSKSRHSYDDGVSSVSDEEHLQITQSLLPVNKQENEQKPDDCTSDGEIRRTCRNRNLILNSDNDNESSFSDTSKENYNPSAQRNNSKIYKKKRHGWGSLCHTLEQPGSHKVADEEYDLSNSKIMGAPDPNTISDRLQRGILHPVEDEEVQIIRTDYPIKNNLNVDSGDDSDDNAEQCRNKVKRYRRQKEEKGGEFPSSSEEEQECALKINRKRELQTQSDNEENELGKRVPKVRIKRVSVPIDDDTSDEDDLIPKENENAESSGDDSAIIEPTTSDMETDEDCDPLENFTKLVSKAKNHRFVTQRTRQKSIYSENLLPKNSSQTAHVSKTIRFATSPQKDKKKDNLDISCIAKRTRRKSMVCESNTLDVANNFSRNHGRRKTVCSETSIEKEKQQRVFKPETTPNQSPYYEKEYDSCEDTDNFVVPDDFVEYEDSNMVNMEKQNSLEISCIANRTRNRKPPTCQIIDEDTSSSYDSANTGSTSSSYYSTSSHISAKSNQDCKARSAYMLRYQEKWPNQNIDFAYCRKNSNKKPYNSSNRHHPHNNNRRRI